MSGPKGSKNISFNNKLFTTKINEKNEFQIFQIKKLKILLFYGELTEVWLTMLLLELARDMKKFRAQRCWFRANLKGQDLVLTLGFSHEVKYTIPKGINVKVEKQTKINIIGADKELVAKTASEIKSLKPVEPYKAKGIKEKDQYVLRKEGKKK